MFTLNRFEEKSKIVRYAKKNSECLEENTNVNDVIDLYVLIAVLTKNKYTLYNKTFIRNEN
jgi:hypothetical protein